MATTGKSINLFFPTILNYAEDKNSFTQTVEKDANVTQILLLLIKIIINISPREKFMSVGTEMN